MLHRLPAAARGDAPQTIPVGANAVSIAVESGGAAQADAWVCLWDGANGQWSGRTDQTGRIVLPVSAPAEGTMKITVTAHDRHPYLATIPMAAAQAYVGFQSATIDDDAGGGSQGNGDGLVNPGETVELPIALKNLGALPAPAVDAVLTSEDPYVEVTGTEASYGTIAPGSTAWGATPFVVSVGWGCPADHVLRFDLAVHSEGSEWHSLMEIPVRAPAFQVEAVQIQDGGNGQLEPGESAGLVLTLRNTGSVAAVNVGGQLLSKSQWVTIVDGSVGFGGIAAGGIGANSADPFSVSVDPAAYRGFPVDLLLVSESNGGMADTMTVTLPLGTAASTDPTGGDAYGYVALDDADTGYADAPVYEWIELDPAYGGDGTELPLSDTGYHQDQSVVIDLPFTFQYYGRPFNQATVCSNGWIVMGATNSTEYRNWTIPGAGAPANILAAFWDDLTCEGGGRIFWRHDQAGHRWIVEWSRLQLEGNMPQPAETFEAILYDPLYHRTDSGDGIIVYQYMTVNNLDDVDNYATVGIQNEDHTVGLLYTYSNLYKPGAAPLQSGRAIRILPALTKSLATIEGVVENASFGGAPAAGVDIRVAGEEIPTRTGADGSYLRHLPEGTYTLIAESFDLAPDTVSGVVVSRSAPARVDFSLTDVAGPSITILTDLEHTDSPGPYPIQAKVNDHSSVTQAVLCWRNLDGEWSETPMTAAGSVYEAAIPSGVPGNQLQYYVRATDGTGRVSTSPAGAPGSWRSFWVTQRTYFTDVEGSITGWQLGVPGDDAAHGIWQPLDPQMYIWQLYGQDATIQVSPEDDHTPAPGVLCFFSGGSGMSVNGGTTTLQSPAFDLTGASAAYVDYYRWYGLLSRFDERTGLTARVSSDGGSTWHDMDRVFDSEIRWRAVTHRLNDYITLTDRVVIRFVACNPDPSYPVSCGIDDFGLEVVPRDPTAVPAGELRVFALAPIRPNPHRGSGVRVEFSLEHRGPARLGIFDVQGRLVRRLLDGPAAAGSQTCFWDGLDEAGRETKAGVFFCRLQAAGRIRTQRIVLVPE